MQEAEFGMTQQFLVHPRHREHHRDPLPQLPPAIEADASEEDDKIALDFGRHIGVEGLRHGPGPGRPGDSIDRHAETVQSPAIACLRPAARPPGTLPRAPFSPSAGESRFAPGKYYVSSRLGGMPQHWLTTSELL